MHPGRARRGKAFNDINRVVCDLLTGFEVTLAKTHSLPAHQVDRWNRIKHLHSPPRRESAQGQHPRTFLDETARR